MEPTNDDVANAQSRGLDANADANPGDTGDTRRTYCFHRNGGIALFMGFYGRHGTRRTLSQQTRNEQVGGSSPLVGSLFFLQIPTKAEALTREMPGRVSSTSAVDSIPKPHPSRRRCCGSSRASSANSGRGLAVWRRDLRASGLTSGVARARAATSRRCGGGHASDCGATRRALGAT